MSTCTVIGSKVCDTPGCSEPAKLQCPTCIKLSIPGSFFCSQKCFKSSWDDHKKLHKLAKSATEKSGKDAYNPYPGFRYSGPLRPAPLSSKRSVPDTIMRPDYADHPTGVSECEKQMRGSTNIRILNDEEIEQMKLITRFTREILDEAAKACDVGVTTDELDRVVHEATIDRDCYPSPLNYFNFPKSCCTSINEVICHGIPDMRPLEDGDICNVDISAFHRGWHGDANETLFVGKNVSEKAKKLVKTTHECLMLAIAEVKPGVRYRELGNVIQKHAQANGYSVVRSYCGHGIHELFHTAPSVPHYGKNKAVGIMKPGQIFTIEPMINEGTWRDDIWPDDWTAVTQDGKLSAQFEHSLLVTDTGCEILTRRREKDGQPWFMDSMS